MFYAFLALAGLIFLFGNKMFGLVMFSVLFLGACALIYYITHNLDGEPAAYMRKFMVFSFLAGLAIMVYNLAKILLVTHNL